ncbi:MAG TPA: DsrE family protein [Burkholderiales bacterium]|nr:DsrE family protein [Burkholderiales bacterium]
MSKRLAILLWAADPDRPEICATPFFHAATAAAMDADVEIYFTSRSVRLLARGVAEGLYPGPTRRQSVYAFMQEAARHGAKFFACPQAMEEHGVLQNQFIPEVTGTAGAAAYIGRCLDAGWRTIVY